MRRTRLRPGKRLRPVNPERRARLREEQFGDHGNRVRALPCCVCSAVPPSDPAHVKSRGAGGTSENLVPLCWRCHRSQHAIGLKAFQSAHHVDLFALAARLSARVPEPNEAPLVARLARIAFPLRGLILHYSPARVPRSVALSVPSKVETWLKVHRLDLEIGRVLDLLDEVTAWKS